ncbi:MAG TPA: VPDSG-CTERM sorting domain-containing protein [Candidatus Acidoferrum sp.]|nr:VPDSG-CTERM sorting domain-containing protein [Candidatus Acidoferrum sp.]
MTGASGSGALSTVNSGLVINISPGGAYTTPTANSLTRWAATESGTHVVALTTLSGGPPSMLIIGPPNASKNLYDDANPSITGDNPSVFETAKFTISIPGVAPSSTFANATIFFGTSADTVGVPDGGATIALLGFALLSVETLRRRIVKV